MIFISIKLEELKYEKKKKKKTSRDNLRASQKLY